MKLGVLWESYRPTSSNHRRKRIYPLSYSFLSSLPFLLLLLQCFISFRQSAKGYKVFTFHTISTRVERDEKKDSLTLPSFWNKKKKNYFNNLFLSSFLYTLGSLPDERIRHNKHTRAIFLDIRIFNLPLPLVCNNLTQRKQNKLKENKEKKSSQCEWIQH